MRLFHECFASLVKPNIHLAVSRRTVDTGDDVTVHCRSFGYPRPTMSISTPKGSVYRFPSPTDYLIVRIGEFAEGGGVYKCSATNIIGEAKDNITVNGVRYLVI